MPLRLCVLGPVTLRGDGDHPSSSRLTQPRQLALLVYLALARPRGLHPREQLMALLWPGVGEAQARRGIRNALYGIRSHLGPDAILSVGSSLVGLDASALSCDAHDLEAGRWIPASPLEPASIVPLDGLDVAQAAPFMEWRAAEVARLHALLRSPAPAPLHAGSGSSLAKPDAAAPRQVQDAYALYVRGHYCFLRAAHDGDPQTLEQCRLHFELALERAPDFAPAVAGLANYYAVAARRGLLQPFEKHFAHCLELSRRALALDEGLAVPHVHFGVEAMYLSDDWARAGREFTLAIHKDPAYAEGHRFLAVWLGVEGRHQEALAAAEEAARLEPDVVTMLGTLGAARAAAGDALGAEAALRRALALDARHAPSRERLLRLLEGQGRYTEAIAERERGAAALDAPGFAASWREGGAEGYRAQRRAELRREVTALESRLIERPPPSIAERFAPPVLRLVSALTMLGERSRARAWQLQAVAERPGLARWFAAVTAEAGR